MLSTGCLTGSWWLWREMWKKGESLCKDKKHEANKSMCPLWNKGANGSRICQAAGGKQGKSIGGLRQTFPWKVRMRNYLLTCLAVLGAAHYTGNIVPGKKELTIWKTDSLVLSAAVLAATFAKLQLCQSLRIGWLPVSETAGLSRWDLDHNSLISLL